MPGPMPGAMLVSDAMLDSAARELDARSMSDIQRTTALTWAARAIASFRKYARLHSLAWLLDAEQYAHEATEHAAFVADAHFANQLGAQIELARMDAIQGSA